MDQKPVSDACFTADTLVATEDGEKSIGKVTVGDKVLAYNQITGKEDYEKVTAVLIKHTNLLEYLDINGEQVKTTPTHPFYTQEKGWVAAGELKTGMHVEEADGSYGVIDSLKQVHLKHVITVYNLTVASDHTYFVGRDQWLVHNSCLPGNPYRGSNAPARAFAHLQRYHGPDPHVASRRLHRIKQHGGLGATDNVAIGHTGAVYDERTGRYLGSLTDSHWGGVTIYYKTGGHKMSQANLSPNAKYDHVFAIIRVDVDAAEGTDPESVVTVTKVLWNQRLAEAETVRLNQLNRDKGAVYFWQVTRLERMEAQQRKT